MLVTSASLTAVDSSELRSPAARPNFVLFLTDDQDAVLGGWTPMLQTRRLLSSHGVTLTNHFVHTPVCCPSRSTLLSGRYFHNIREPRNSSQGGCMHVELETLLPHNIARRLGAVGYTVGYFGKHVNNCPRKPPPGFDCDTCWFFANGGGKDVEPGGYLNASFNDFARWPALPSVNGLYYASTAGEYAGYTTSVIANKSLEWVRAVSRRALPFWATVAPKAPHAPFTPAPWYERGTFIDSMTAERGGSYNASAAMLAQHHELIAKQMPISPTCAADIDENFRNRLRCLLSVDDAVGAMVRLLEELKLLDETYVILTSDHGYNLGQHRLPFGKHNTYDHDIRVPFVIRGPGIPHGGTLSQPASHADLAPTMLGLAGADAVPAPAGAPEMDGRSLAPLLLQESAVLEGAVPLHAREHVRRELAHRRGWRDFHLVEYIALGNYMVNCRGPAASGPDLHLLDDVISNTYRSLRFVASERAVPGVHPPLRYGDLLYAEFTAVEDQWEFSNIVHYELFNVSADPHQLHNLYYTAAPKAWRDELHHMVAREFVCAGPSCL